MRPPRILELAVFLLVAFAVLLPRPDVKVKPALALDDPARERVAELQAVLDHEPGNVAASLELADLCLAGRRPDCALGTLAPALARAPSDHRLHAKRAVALADHFEPGPGYLAVEKALALCESGSVAPCGEGEKARLGLIKAMLGRIKHLDVRNDPNTAKENLYKEFKPTFLPKAQAKRP